MGKAILRGTVRPDPNPYSLNGVSHNPYFNELCVFLLYRYVLRYAYRLRYV